MIEQTDAIDVYFEDEMQVLVNDVSAFSMEALKSVLETKEVQFSEITTRPNI